MPFCRRIFLPEKPRRIPLKNVLLMVSFPCTHWRLHTVIFCRYSASVEIHFSILMMIRGAFYVIFEHKNKYSIWKSFPLRKHIFSTSREEFAKCRTRSTNANDDWAGKRAAPAAEIERIFHQMQYENFLPLPPHSHSAQNCMTTAMWKILQSCPIAPHPFVCICSVCRLTATVNGLSSNVSFNSDHHPFRQMKQVHRSILNSITGSWWDSGIAKEKLSILSNFSTQKHQQQHSPVQSFNSKS